MEMQHREAPAVGSTAPAHLPGPAPQAAPPPARTPTGPACQTPLPACTSRGSTGPPRAHRCARPARCPRCGTRRRAGAHARSPAAVLGARCHPTAGGAGAAGPAAARQPPPRGGRAAGGAPRQAAMLQAAEPLLLLARRERQRAGGRMPQWRAPPCLWVQLTCAAPAAPSSVPLALRRSPTAAPSTCRLQPTEQSGTLRMQSKQNALNPCCRISHATIACMAGPGKGTCHPIRSRTSCPAHLPASQSQAPALAACPAPWASSLTARWLPGFGGGLLGLGMLPRCQQSPPTCTAGGLRVAGSDAAGEQHMGRIERPSKCQ